MNAVTLTTKQTAAVTWLQGRRDQAATQADATRAGFSRSVFVALEAKGVVRKIHIAFVNVDKWVLR